MMISSHKDSDKIAGLRSIVRLKGAITIAVVKRMKGLSDDERGMVTSWYNCIEGKEMKSRLQSRHATDTEPGPRRELTISIF